MNIETARIYKDKEDSDKITILVDRLWPRGVSKEDAHLDHWHKEWAPSDDLRNQFHDDEISWGKFAEQYKEELDDKKEQILSDLEDLDKRKVILLLYGSKDEDHNNAVVLKEFLENL